MKMNRWVINADLMHRHVPIFKIKSIFILFMHSTEVTAFQRRKAPQIKLNDAPVNSKGCADRSTPSTALSKNICVTQCFILFGEELCSVAL